MDPQSNQTLIWYHDGMETAADVENEGTIGNVQDLNTCRGKTAIAAIYTLLIVANICNENFFSSFFSDSYMPCVAIANGPHQQVNGEARRGTSESIVSRYVKHGLSETERKSNSPTLNQHRTLRSTKKRPSKETI